MKIHKRNIETQEVVMNIKYPRLDMAFIPDNPWEYFIEEIDAKPSYDSRTHTCTRLGGVFSEIPHAIYPHIKIYSIGWETTQLSNEQIIANLNNALGEYLDTTCPTWMRTKFNTEGVFFLELMVAGTVLTTEQQARITYLKAVQAWFTICRAERDIQEAALINNGTLPSFTFSQSPS